MMETAFELLLQNVMSSNNWFMVLSLLEKCSVQAARWQLLPVIKPETIFLSLIYLHLSLSNQGKEQKINNNVCSGLAVKKDSDGSVTCVSSKERYELSEVTLLEFLEMWLSKRGVGSIRFFMFS